LADGRQIYGRLRAAIKPRRRILHLLSQMHFRTLRILLLALTLWVWPSLLPQAQQSQPKETDKKPTQAQQAAPAQQAAKPPGPPPTPVVVAPVKEANEAPRASFSGFMEPLEKARVSAVEAGYVKSILKRSGERVKKDEVLAVLANPQLLLDLDVLTAQVKESEALLAEAKLKLNRVQTLFNKQLVPAEQLENEKAGGAVLQARLETTRSNRDRVHERLKMLVLRTPIDGQIITADLDLGQWITPNTEVYQVSNFERIQLRVGVPSKYVNDIPEGAIVTVAVPEIGARLDGKIRAVVRHVDSATGNFTVRIYVDNPKNLPLSGLLAQASLPTGEVARVKLVPRDAIVRRGEFTQVVVVRDNVAQIVPVQVRGDVRDSVIVDAPDLKAEEPVVVRGNERLFPGMPVAVSKAQ
jgi:RND family efflux transporter MFP subunit